MSSQAGLALLPYSHWRPTVGHAAPAVGAVEGHPVTGPPELLVEPPPPLLEPLPLPPLPLLLCPPPLLELPPPPLPEALPPPLELPLAAPPLDPMPPLPEPVPPEELPEPSFPPSVRLTTLAPPHAVAPTEPVRINAKSLKRMMSSGRKEPRELQRSGRGISHNVRGATYGSRSP